MATVPPATPPEAQAPINHLSRLWGALVSPKATFEDIAQRPSWIVPLVVLTILTIGVTAIFSTRVGWERLITQQLEQNPRTAQMTPEQRQQAVERALGFTKVAGYIGAVLSYLIIILVVSAVLMGAFNLVGGARVRFSTAMGVVSHALMPLAIAGVLGIIILFLKDPETVNLENLVGSNVGAFLSADSPRWLMRLGTSLDLFSFWAIFLLATGFAVADPKKVSLGKGLGIVIGIWAVYVLIRVGWAAAFS